jgi:hypothetical protein
MVQLAFHRWQPEQLCGGLMFRSVTNWAAAAAPDFAAIVAESRLKMSAFSRTKLAGSSWD